MKAISFALYAFATFSAVSAGHHWTTCHNDTIVTTYVTVTDYTTYCPKSTEVTLTTCDNWKCVPTTVTVTEETTLTVSGECLIPTTVTTSATITVEAGAGKAAVGAAGVAGILALLV